MSDTELDTKLSQAITIFRYIEDKDIFQKVALFISTLYDFLNGVYHLENSE